MCICDTVYIDMFAQEKLNFGCKSATAAPLEGRMKDTAVPKQELWSYTVISATSQSGLLILSRPSVLKLGVARIDHRL